MSSSKRIVLVSILILISVLTVTFSVHAEKKEKRAVFQGQVIEISAKFITVERASIALPKKIKTLDSSGAIIPFGTIKKGDYVIVTVEKNEATIQRTGRTRTEGNEKLFKQ